jgi:hypothetical protein
MASHIDAGVYKITPLFLMLTVSFGQSSNIDLSICGNRCGAVTVGFIFTAPNLNNDFKY